MSFARDYRPQTFDEVIGQPAAVAVLKGLKAPECIMISGPPGCGKTTLARIVAKHILGCEKPREVNGSDKTKVEDWREVLEEQHFTSIGGDKRVIIIDECQALSGSSWNVLLKPMEEPPEDWHWILCTTHPEKVPKAIKTRAVKAEVRPLDDRDLVALLRGVSDKQGLDVTEGDWPERLELVAEAAAGCPREALHKYEIVQDADSLEDVRLLLDREDEEKDKLSVLCRMIIDGDDLQWNVVRGLVGKPTNDQAQQFRSRIADYLSGAAYRGKFPIHLLGALELFTERYPPENAAACLAVSLGTLVHGTVE
jgi:DNA polymerase III gamma/tau subunit